MVALVLLLKATVLLSVALVTGRLLGHSAAPLRHALWSLTFVALVALPALDLAGPALPVPVMTPAAPVAPSGASSFVANTAQPSVPALDEALDSAAPGHGEPALPALRKVSWPSPAALMAALWVSGLVLALLRLLAAHVRFARLLSRARTLDCPAWQSDHAELCRRLGLGRPVRLRTSGAASTPMAGGVLRPVVVLPEQARTWSAERRRVVLSHELIHLRRLDPLRHAVARVALAVYWFHPLAWIAARRASVAREQACDESVLALGTRPSSYAQHLVELAESLRPAAFSAALSMIHSSPLEKRVMAILEPQPRPASRLAMLGTVCTLGALMVSVAIAQPMPGKPQSSPAAVTGATAAAASVVPVPAPAPAVAPQDDSACSWTEGARGNFSGSMSISTDDDGVTIREQVGTRNGRRVVQRTYGDTRICMTASDNVGFDNDTFRPVIGQGGRVLLETQRNGHVQRLVIEGTGAGEQNVFTVDGAQRPFDAQATQWRDDMFAVLTNTWEISTLRGEVSSLRGEISSIRGHRSSLQGEISSARGHVSSLRGQISSARGHVSSLRGQISSVRGHVSSLEGQISSINGHVSSLRGAISSERGAISSLQGARRAASDETRASIDADVAKHEARIAEIEDEIEVYDAESRIAEVREQIADYDLEARVADLERQIADYDLEARVADLEQQIADYELEGHIEGVEAQIEALDVDGQVERIEAQIEAMDADRRIEQLQQELERELAALERSIDAIS